MEPAPTARKTSPLAPDLSLSSVFHFEDLDHLEAVYAGQEQGFLYARDGHPGAKRLAEALAELEGAGAGLVVSSGMAATAAVLLDRLRPGDHAVAAAELYGKTRILLADRLSAFGVAVDFVDARDLAAVKVAVRPGTRLLWVESLSNPSLQAAAVDELASIAHAAGAILAVDSTFSPPPILRPIELGADLVVHSLTKILCGHSDVTLGCVVGRADLIRSIAESASIYGWHAAALDCWLVERSLPTLAMRVERACENAMKLAEFLSAHPSVLRVEYPGLPRHPSQAWLAARSKWFGYMLSFEVAGGRDAVNRLFRKFERVFFCPSLGDVQTTVSHPASTSHRGWTPEQREQLGIGDGLVRVSVGVESSGELIADFAQALSSLL